MDFLVNLETRTIRVDPRHQKIFDQFWEEDLFPLLRIVRTQDGDDEIIDVYTVTVEKMADGTYDLITRQVEIVREPDLDLKPLPQAWMN